MSRFARVLSFGWGVAALLLLTSTPLTAQYSSDFEAATFDASDVGVDLNGQDTFYLPAAGGVTGLVYTYAGNALGLPDNPTGGEQFVGSTGPGASTFSRSQRDVVYGAGTGVWRVAVDIAATFTGTLPTAQNIGSLSTQEFASPATSQTFIMLARWSDVATASEWNADYVWYDAAGTQLTETLCDPAFQNLAIDHWYRWATTFALDTNQILQVDITDIDTGITTIHIPPEPRYLGGGAAGGLAVPSGFRFFAGSSAVAGNTLAFDNIDIEELATPCAGPTNLVCSSVACDPGPGDVELIWDNPGGLDSVEIFRGCELLATLAGSDVSYTDTALAAGSYDYSVRGICTGSLVGTTPVTCTHFHCPIIADVSLLMNWNSTFDTAATAAAEMALPVTTVTTDAELLAELSSGTVYPMVIIENPSNNFTAGTIAAIVDYVTGGGKVLLAYWNLDTSPALQTAFGVQSVVDIFDPQPVYAVDATDAIWDGPHGAVGSPIALSGATPWIDDGDLMTSVDATTEKGSYDTTGATGIGQGAIILANDDRTIINSFMADNMDLDQAKTLWKNEIELLLLGGGGGPQFIRGDANGDGTFDISDAVYTLSALFVPGSPAPGCEDAADSNDDGTNDISDAVYSLSALFVPGSPAPPAPHPDCGEDPTPTTCADYTACP